jgi:hypothetical protein
LGRKVTKFNFWALSTRFWGKAEIIYLLPWKSWKTNPPAKDFHSVFRLREDSEREIILTNALEIHFINMVKYRKQGRSELDKQSLNNPLCRWLTWFNKRSPPELLMEVIKMDTAIQTAALMSAGFAGVVSYGIAVNILRASSLACSIAGS